MDEGLTPSPEPSEPLLGPDAPDIALIHVALLSPASTDLILRAFRRR